MYSADLDFDILYMIIAVITGSAQFQLKYQMLSHNTERKLIKIELHTIHSYLEWLRPLKLYN